MAETDTPQPMNDSDDTPPTNTSFEPAEPLKDTGVAFTPEADPASSGGKIADARQAVGNSAASLQQQASDRIRSVAEEGLDKAGETLDQFAQMLVEAAAQVDEKLGAQFGDYARTAATTVQGFADTVREKDVDELAGEVRGYIRRSPAAAVGVTAALGFALARMVHAGLDQRA